VGGKASEAALEGRDWYKDFERSTMALKIDPSLVSTPFMPRPTRFGRISDLGVWRGGAGRLPALIHGVRAKKKAGSGSSSPSYPLQATDVCGSFAHQVFDSILCPGMSHLLITSYTQSFCCC
jgi:hypothetical protein